VRPQLFGDHLSKKDERLVATARDALGRIAATLEARHSGVISDITFLALLDGAEIVMRSELSAGASIEALMPSFVFLIALPMVDNDEALELARRTSILFDQISV
jgi:hypothetical protein